MYKVPYSKCGTLEPLPPHIYHKCCYSVSPGSLVSWRKTASMCSGGRKGRAIICLRKRCTVLPFRCRLIEKNVNGNLYLKPFKNLNEFIFFKSNQNMNLPEVLDLVWFKACVQWKTQPCITVQINLSWLKYNNKPCREISPGSSLSMALRI